MANVAVFVQIKAMLVYNIAVFVFTRGKSSFSLRDKILINPVKLINLATILALIMKLEQIDEDL